MVQDNSQLITLNGLDNIDPRSISEIIVKQNPNLEVCNVASVCTFLEEHLGPYQVNNNAPGCETAVVIAETWFYFENFDSKYIHI